jgi:DNA-binding NarL/FixJ family response regulator
MPADTAPLRVLIAEDQLLLREGLGRLLGESGFEVVALAADAPELLRKVAAHHPDVAIVDVQMPPNNEDDGLRGAIEIRRRHPEVGVLMLSQFRDEAYAIDLIGDDARGVGYLLKDRIADLDSFTDAIRRVAAGGSALDPEIVALMVGRRRARDPLAELTPRERDVLALMAEGKSNIGIAQALGVTLAAVEKHVGRIFGKLGLSNEPSEHRRVLAVLTLLRQA